MKALPILLLYFLFAGPSEAKWFWKCELAEIFLKEGLDGYAGYFLEDWMCAVYYESWYNTRYKRIYQGFGIFQFNHRFWCKDRNVVFSYNLCNICCSRFRDDDVRDDIMCAKKLADTPRGLDHFEMWRYYCKGQNIKDWLWNCSNLDRAWKKI